VWTGKALKEKYEVDHVIPFDLWHNNDLWNLMPATINANRQKSNRLPSADLLIKRKDRIISYWEEIRTLEECLFKREAETLLVLPLNNWQNALFGQLAASIEMTALQRGVGRWTPN
jgi:hypothetical protein